jgi:uncharacterized C2H2 Zn-finger protein
MGNIQAFRILVRKREGNILLESPIVGEEFRSSEMYHSHEKFFKHSMRILVNIYSTSSIIIKNKKAVTL